jgi:hypothetical protein
VDQLHGVVRVLEDRPQQPVEPDRHAGGQHAQARHLLGPRHPLLQTPLLVRDPLSLDRVTDRAGEHRRDRQLVLEHEVLGSGLERAERDAQLDRDGQDHDRESRRPLAQAHHRLDAAAVGQVEIEQHGIDVRFPEVVEALLERLDPVELEAAGLVAERAAHLGRIDLVVLDQKHVDRVPSHVPPHSGLLPADGRGPGARPDRVGSFRRAVARDPARSFLRRTPSSSNPFNVPIPARPSSTPPGRFGVASHNPAASAAPMAWMQESG